MKKFMYLFALIAILAIATKESIAQTGVLIHVRGQLVAGITSPAGPTTLCWNSPAGLISGTLPTGGQGIYTYQWQKSTNAGGTWANIIGAIGQNYDPGNLIADAQFRRNDTDACGMVTTNIISFTVYGQFIAGGTTGGNTPLCNGADGGTLTSTAGSGGAAGTTYQWENSTNGGTNWATIPGATLLTYATGLLTQTTSFRLGFVNPSCGTLYGNIITITVYNVFAGGTVTGGNTPLCNGANGGILTSTAPTGGAPGTTLQWESSLDGVNYNPIVGQTGLTINLGNLTVTTWYRLKYTNLCAVLYSNVTNIVVYNVFAQGTTTLVGATPTCYNTDPGSFTGTIATGGAPGTTYQWQSSTNGGASWGNILGAIGQNYDPGALIATTSFRRQDVNLCNTLYTNVITIVVYADFVPGVVGLAQIICYNTIPNLMVFTTPPTGGDGAYTYQWYSSPTPGGPWTLIPGAINSSYQPPALTVDIYYSCWVNTSCGSSPALP